jgi:hypothetical protein
MQSCPYCDSSITNAAIDIARDLAVCPGCRSVVDFRRHEPTYASGPETMRSSYGPRDGLLVPKPVGIAVSGTMAPGAQGRRRSGTQPSPSLSTDPRATSGAARGVVDTVSVAPAGSGAALSSGLAALDKLSTDRLDGGELVASQPPTPSARLRPEVPLPKRLSLVRSPGSDAATLTVTQRWSRTSALLLLVVLAVGGAWWVVGGGNWAPALRWGVAALLAVVAYGALSGLLGRTTTRVFGGSVEVRHGPLPSLKRASAPVAAEQIKLLSAVKLKGGYGVRAVLQSGARTVLVAPVLATPPQALYVVDQIADALGLD